MRPGWTQAGRACRSNISINIISDIIDKKPPKEQEANAIKSSGIKVTFSLPNNMSGFLKDHRLGDLIIRPYQFGRIVMAMFMVLSCGVARADITSGMIVDLTMNQTNGFTAYDSTTNGNNAALTDFMGNSQWVAGETNGALNFNATTNNQWAMISDSNGQLNLCTNSNTALTVAVWVKASPGVQPLGAGIIAKGYGHGGEKFAMDIYNQYRFYVRNAAGTSITLGPVGPVDGNWHHLVGIYNGINTNNGLQLYVDGQLAASNNAPASLLSNTHVISLGSRENTSTSGYTLPLYGALEEVQIFNRALTAADVQQLYLESYVPPVQIPDAAFDALRLKWLASLTGGTNLNLNDPNALANISNITASAQSLWTTMNTASGRTYLWSNLNALTNNSSDIWDTYLDLETMAMAYSAAGSGLYTNALLFSDISSGLDWMYANIYNEHNANQYDNWWDWQIGAPLALNNITVLLYNNLTGAQITNYMNAVNHFTPAPISDGANLVWTATVVGLRGAIVRDSSKLVAASDSLSSVFLDVTNGDGFRADGSFVYHDYYSYTGSYGESLIQYIVPLVNMLNGSQWAVTDPNETNMFQWVYNSFQPVIYNGLIMDMTRGRAISRYDETSQFIGGETVAAIIQMAQFASPNDAAAFKSMAKYWMQADTVTNFVASTDLGTVALAQSILADDSIPSRGELIGHYTFGQMDRVVHLRPGYAFGVSMFSSRMADFESINQENLHGWYTGYGMTYIYNSDQTQYDDCFWPTVNAYQLPGTTVDTQFRANLLPANGQSSSGAAFLGTNTWTGGATLNNWGAAGMQMNAWNTDLVAKKSWFMFNDEILCLGAGITCTSNYDVQTIVEDRKLTSAGTNDFIVNGDLEPDYLGWTGSLSGVTWAYLTGNTTGADIGYYFPQPAKLNGTRTIGTGSWYAIDPYEVGSPIVPDSRNYLTLWFDHGTNPVDGMYSYVLLPGKSAAFMASYADSPQVSVIQNSGSIQAVSQGPLGITAANFWIDGNQTIGPITINRKSSVIMQLTETNVAVAVADPTQTNTTGITMTLNQPVTQVISLDSGVSVIQLSPSLQFTVATSGAAGKSFHANFSYNLTNFIAWQNVYFTPAQLANPAISGLTADPAQDGVNNLMKYALMLDPWLPAGNTTQTSLINGNFTFTYNRREWAADLQYSLDVSTNLTSWDTSGAQFSQSIVSDNGFQQVIQVTESSAGKPYPTRFFRLRITYLP
jgi:hyaluronate lyase